MNKSELFIRAHIHAKKRKSFRPNVPYRKLFAAALKEGYASVNCVAGGGYTSLKYRNFWGHEKKIA